MTDLEIMPEDKSMPDDVKVIEFDEDTDFDHLDVETTVNILNLMAKIIWENSKEHWEEVDNSEELAAFIARNLPILATEGREVMFKQDVAKAAEKTKEEGYTYDVSPSAPSVITAKFEFSPNDVEMLKKLVPMLEIWADGGAIDKTLDTDWERESLWRTCDAIKKAMHITPPDEDDAIARIQRQIDEANK